jgi:hypothetical protein
MANNNTGRRATRDRNRLIPVDTTFLGQPTDLRRSLPPFIGEMRNKGGNQSLTNNTKTTITFAGGVYTADRAGYSTIYDSATDIWTIPPGLSGIWRISGILRFDANTTGRRDSIIWIDEATEIYTFRLDAENIEQTVPFDISYPLNEGQTFNIRGLQNSGGDLSVLSGSTNTFCIAEYKGVL